MSNILEVSGVYKYYGDFRMENASFSLPKGYVMGLIGPNGAGKTTIIKMIMNLVMNQSGEIKIFDSLTCRNKKTYNLSFPRSLDTLRNIEYIKKAHANNNLSTQIVFKLESFNFFN